MPQDFKLTIALGNDGGWAADSWGACRRCGLPFPDDLPRAAAYEEE
jgi:hypothetical protein